MTEDAQTLLREVVELSHEFGSPEFVKGGGGNTSVKTDSTLWVKPSGTSLAGLAPEALVALDRGRLSRLYAYTPAPDPATREREVLALMGEARQPGQTGRPSVETPLHDLLQARFVVHTHGELVNGLTCARQGAETANRLFPGALWIPYTDPGYTLSMRVKERVDQYVGKHARQPEVILLENHGVFVSGQTVREIRRCTQTLMDTLSAAYRDAGIPTALTYGLPVRAEEMPGLITRVRSFLGPDAAHVEVSAPFAVAEGPLTPDHMVYAKARAYSGEWHETGLRAFREQTGYVPRVLVTRTAVLGVGRTAKAARLALELALDGARVRQLAEAFGGVQYMSEPARRFIESWEVESYREQQALK